MTHHRTASLALIVLLMHLAGCATSIANRDPTGERFPSVTGESLAGDAVRLPDDLAGQPAILLIGYVQDTQFDIDRWLLGFAQAGVEVPILELPTIPGRLALFASNWIDGGMREGIPKEDWRVVVTLYGESAPPVLAFTGNERPRNARVIVLAPDGTVAWFHDRGYGTRQVLEIVDLTQSLAAGE